MLVGRVIPEDDSAWRLYLLFLKVVDICYAPRISSAALTDLELLLQCFYQDFKLVYLDEKITPKMYYLLIYTRLIKQVGPLAQFCCMRCEAKHKYCT